PYNLRILPGAIKDIHGGENSDTLMIKFNKKEEKNYANLELILESKPEIPMVLKLFKDKELHSERILGIGDTLVRYALLSPGSYTIQVVLDENHNGKWDTGSYTKKIQPELCIWFREPIILRSN